MSLEGFRTGFERRNWPINELYLGRFSKWEELVYVPGDSSISEQNVNFILSLTLIFAPEQLFIIHMANNLPSRHNILFWELDIGTIDCAHPSFRHKFIQLAQSNQRAGRPFCRDTLPQQRIAASYNQVYPRSVPSSPLRTHY